MRVRLYIRINNIQYEYIYLQMPFEGRSPYLYDIILSYDDMLRYIFACCFDGD